MNYEESLWDQIHDALNKPDFDGIDVINRAQIVDDALNLARANILQYKTALSLTEYLKNEEQYYPWYSAFSGFSYLRRRLGSTSLADKLNVSYISILSICIKN